jgi:hypothetical protein
MAFLGNDGRVEAREIPRLLMDTEVGHPGQGPPRYRPSYYGVRLVEAALWGAAPRAWYTAHLVVFAAAVTLGWRFLARWIGLVPGAVLVLYLLTFPCWGDVFSRLGPSEAYCVLGTGLYLEGMARIAPLGGGRRRGGWSAYGGWAMLGLGAWLAMGSKENFLVLLLPLWGLVLVLWWRGGLGWGGVTVCALLTLYGAIIICAVGVSVLLSGADVHANPVTVSGRLGLVWPGVQRAIEPLKVWHGALALIVAFAPAAPWAGSRVRWLWRPVLWGALLACGLVMLYVSQFVFYNGAWPQAPGGLRYDFPGGFARSLVVVTGVVMAMAVLRRLRVPGVLVRAVGAGLVALLCVATVRAGWGPLTQSSAAHASATREWTARLERIAARLRQDPARPVVVVSHDIWDYEPIFAIPRFLTAKSVVNPLFLATPIYRTDTALTEALAGTVLDTSRRGLAGYRPFHELSPTPPPIAIGLSGTPPPQYEDAGSLWPMPAVGAR